jgi:serine/threonine protein kinase
MAVVNVYPNKNGVPERLNVNDKPLASGGEGAIYRSKDGYYVVKIYHPGKVVSERKSFLERIKDLRDYLKEDEKKFLCWPLATIKDVEGNPRIGCVTKFIPFPKLAEMNQSPLRFEKQIRENYKSWAHYLQIARGIAQRVTTLHEKGCVHADLSNNNFFVDPDTCEVILFDLDGLVVAGFLPAFVKGTKGIIAREIMLGEATPNELSERHSLAVQILQTLLFRNVFLPQKTYDNTDVDRDEEIGWGLRLTFSEDPRDNSNTPHNLNISLIAGGSLSYKMLTPSLQKLTERACLEGLRNPSRRPSAQEWIDTLSYALDELYLCSRCHIHFPYPHWIREKEKRRCPFCGQTISSDLPSVGSLYEPQGVGKYIVTSRYLVMSNNWRLFSDLLYPHQPPPMHRRNEKSIGHVEKDRRQGINCLVNDEGGIWKARSKDNEKILVAGKGDSIPLLPGSIINFGDDKRLLFLIE